MTDWIFSDSHFYHKNIILPTHSNRPFANIDEMNEGLINNHNDLVSKEDDFYCLGDFSLSEKYVPIILPRLNGKRKFLILGNHDKPHPTQHKDNENRPAKVEAAKKRYIEYGWTDVVLEMRLGPFLLHHMPYTGDSREGKERFSEFRPKDDGHTWLLHGHRHSKPEERVRTRMIDCGVDGNNYRPIQFEALIEIMEKNK